MTLKQRWHHYKVDLRIRRAETIRWTIAWVFLITLASVFSIGFVAAEGAKAVATLIIIPALVWALFTVTK